MASWRYGSGAVALCAALLLAPPALAYEVKRGDIAVQDPWTTATLRPNLTNSI